MTGAQDNGRGVELSKFKYAVRGMPDANQRIQALLGQLQPVQRPLTIHSYEKPTMVRAFLRLFLQCWSTARHTMWYCALVASADLISVPCWHNRAWSPPSLATQCTSQCLTTSKYRTACSCARPRLLQWTALTTCKLSAVSFE